MSEIEYLIESDAYDIICMVADEVKRRMRGGTWEHHQLLYTELIKELIMHLMFDDCVNPEICNPTFTEELFLEIREYLAEMQELNQTIDH